jgi:hypothetical protein
MHHQPGRWSLVGFAEFDLVVESRSVWTQAVVAEAPRSHTRRRHPIPNHLLHNLRLSHSPISWSFGDLHLPGMISDWMQPFDYY